MNISNIDHENNYKVSPDSAISCKNNYKISSNSVEYENNYRTSSTNAPEIITNNLYTPAFLKQQIGKLVRVEFLIGTNNLVDRVGILEDVGISYILLRSIESGNILYCDLYSIKFVAISARPYRIDNNYQI